MGRSNRKGLPAQQGLSSGAYRKGLRDSSLEDIHREVLNRQNNTSEALRLSGVIDSSIHQAADGSNVLDIASLNEEIEFFLERDGGAYFGELVMDSPQRAEAILSTFYQMSPDQARAVYERAAKAKDIDDSIGIVIDSLVEPVSGREIIDRSLFPKSLTAREYSGEDGASVFVHAFKDPEMSELYPSTLPSGNIIWEGNTYRGELVCRAEGQRLSFDLRCEEKRNKDGNSFRAEAWDHEVVVAQAFGDKGEPQQTVVRIRRDGDAEEMRQISSEEVADAGGMEGWALLELGRGLRQKAADSASSEDFDQTDTDQQIERLLA